MSEIPLKLSDGAMTVVEDFGGTGPLIVGVHGLGSSRRGWARIAEALRSRFRVVAYDQRGHGDAADARDLRFIRGTLDCIEVCTAINEPIHALLGHSWGGAIVVAAGRQGVAQRVVAVDPMLVVDEGVWMNSVMPIHSTMLAKSLPEREASIRSANTGLPQIETDAKLHATQRLTIEPIAALGVDNEMDNGGWNHRELLANYPLPLLLAVAGQSRSVFSPADRAFVQERGGPNVTLKIFEGASHSLQRDAFDQFMPELEAFLG
jgi:pimeloyl-ACP methyl ester carboxylesterase